MKNVFIVERQGVYQQGTVGIYTNLDLAKKKAREAILAEPDDYHSFYVVCVKVDETENLKDQGGDSSIYTWVQTLRRKGIKSPRIIIEDNNKYRPVPAEDSPECGA